LFFKVCGLSECPKKGRGGCLAGSQVTKQLRATRCRSPNSTAQGKFCG
jgi:hypothetical protein